MIRRRGAPRYQRLLRRVVDSLVVYLDPSDDDGTSGVGELVLFVALAAGVELTDELRGRIEARLRSELSPRHVPDRIEAVPAVPRTLSGKKPIARRCVASTSTITARVPPGPWRWSSG